MSERKRAAGGGDEEAKREYQFSKCPVCGKRYVTTRSFCDCGRRLPDDVYYSTAEPELGRAVNVEDPNHTPCCPRCKENCGRCYHFGAGKGSIDRSGKVFGGAGCAYRKNDPRCTCCQNFIRGAFKVREPYCRAGVSLDGEAFTGVIQNDPPRKGR